MTFHAGPDADRRCPTVECVAFIGAADRCPGCPRDVERDPFDVLPVWPPAGIVVTVRTEASPCR